MTRWAKDVSPANALPEYPRPRLVRQEWQNLNGLWEFAAAKPGEYAPIGKSLDRQILVPFPIESALSGVGERIQEAWYRRTFVVDDWIKSGRRVLLHFGAVDWETRVWVNGKFLGMHRGGYGGFSFDVTEALKPDGEQEVVVGVWDPSDQGFQPAGKQAVRPEGIWYTPTTGIWQTVWLEPVSATHIERVRFTPDLDQSSVHVEVEVAGLTVPGLAAIVVRDPSDGGRVVAGERMRIQPALGRAATRLTIPNAKPWSPDSPHLYDVAITLDAKTPQCDHVESYFGLRKISLGKDDKGLVRIHLNNEFVFQFGPLDQGFWPDGIYTAPTDEALRFDIEMTKQLGFNMSRKHVKIEPDRWYYWADKLGLIVWQDMPSGDTRVAPGLGEMKRSAQSARQFETELAAMVDQLHNHPSIVTWVLFNEGWGQYDTKRLSDWLAEKDPSRLVIGASGWNDLKTGHIHDVHNYPAPRAPKAEKERAIVNGEYGGLGLAIEGHTWQAKDNWGYQRFSTIDEMNSKYEEFVDQVRILKGNPGLSAAIYTQITDVEIEVNGLLTYDREMVKGDVYRFRAVNTSVHDPPPVLTEVVSNATGNNARWRYTTEAPPENWMQADFDHGAWKLGEAGFGSLKAPNARIRTVWTTPDIWLRREVEIPDRDFAKLLFHLHHDDNVEIFLNGQRVCQLDGWTTDYSHVPLSPEALALLRPGKNVIAVHCHQDSGEQYIDLGILERVEGR